MACPQGCLTVQYGMFCSCGAVLDTEPSRVEWFKGVTSDAWHGRRPALQHLSVNLLDDDGSGGAQRAREYNAINVMVAA